MLLFLDHICSKLTIDQWNNPVLLGVYLDCLGTFKLDRLCFRNFNMSFLAREICI